MDGTLRRKRWDELEDIEKSKVHGFFVTADVFGSVDYDSKLCFSWRTACDPFSKNRGVDRSGRIHDDPPEIFEEKGNFVFVLFNLLFCLFQILEN